MFRALRLLGQAAVAACVLIGWSGTGTAGAQSACADLGGTVDAAQICSLHSADSSHTVDLSFPVSYPDQQALADYLRQSRDNFIRFAQRPPAHDWRYELVDNVKTYQSGTPATGTDSVVLKMGQSADPHPVAWYKAFNYDLTKHAAITFETLFIPGSKPLDVLSPIVQRELGKHHDVGPLSLQNLSVDAYQNFPKKGRISANG